MKKFIIGISTTILIIACSKGSDTTSSTNNGGGTIQCSGAVKSFASDVNPIIQSVCAASGCHNSGSINGPGPLLTYQQVFAARVSIRSAVASGLMPQNSTLSATQKSNIVCWIDNGAPNN